MPKLLKNIVGNIERSKISVIFLICCLAVGITLFITRYITHVPLPPDVLVTLNGKPFVTTQFVKEKIEMENTCHSIGIIAKIFAMRVFDTTCLSLLADEWIKQHPEHKEAFLRGAQQACKDGEMNAKITKNRIFPLTIRQRYEYQLKIYGCQLEVDGFKESYFMHNALKTSTPQESSNRSQRCCQGHSLLLEYLDEIRETFNIKILKENLVTFLEEYRGSFQNIPQLADVTPSTSKATPFLPQPNIKP